MRSWLSQRLVEAAARAAARRGVSKVARSRDGFLAQFRASGRRMHPWWKARRAAFIARHFAQVIRRGEPLYDKGGRPTRRHLALAVWAFSPDPRGLARSLRTRSGRST